MKFLLKTLIGIGLLTNIQTYTGYYSFTKAAYWALPTIAPLLLGNMDLYKQMKKNPIATINNGSLTVSPRNAFNYTLIEQDKSRFGVLATAPLAGHMLLRATILGKKVMNRPYARLPFALINTALTIGASKIYEYWLRG